MKKILFLFFIINILSMDNTFANINQEMNDFWNRLGGNSNSNSATIVKGQTSGYYTMGSIQARSPSKNINPINIQLPSIRAGCGGIDMFAGAFSFINGEELIAFGRAVLQNALGYGFQLSLQVLSPAMSSVMTRLHSWANEMNQFNMNSCRTAQSLVNGAVGLFNSNISSSCENIANSSGSSTDRTAAVLACQNPNKLNNEINKESPSNRPANINIVWQALKDGGYIDVLGTDMAQDLMFLMGTIVVRMENGTGTIQKVNPGLWTDSTLDVILNGGNLLTWECDETTLCLNPRRKTSTRVISQENAFKPKVTKILDSIETKMRNINTAEELSAEELKLINITTFPVVRILLTSAQSGGMTSINSDVLADITARDILINFTQEIASSVLESVSRFKSASSNENEIKEVENNIRLVKRYLQEKSIESHNTFNQAISIISVSQEFDRALAEDWASRMRGSLNFSNQLNNR